VADMTRREPAAVAVVVVVVVPMGRRKDLCCDMCMYTCAGFWGEGKRCEGHTGRKALGKVCPLLTAHPSFLSNSASAGVAVRGRRRGLDHSVRIGWHGTYTQIHPPHAKLDREKHLPRGLGRGGGTAKEGFHHTQSAHERGGGAGGLHGPCLLMRAGKGSGATSLCKGGRGEGGGSELAVAWWRQSSCACVICVIKTQKGMK